MRDSSESPAPGPSDPDPTRRAQKLMRKPLPKRFFKKVGVGEENGQHAILLDGKPLRTPARQPFVVPTRTLAEAVAAEWDAQTEEIDPALMPMTRLANTALDGIAQDPQAVAEDIVRFSASDLLCYRAGEPDELVARQAEHWDPVIDWAHLAFGARFVLAEGVVHVEQPRETIAAFSAHLRRFATPLELAALHTMTTLTGSALLALAVADRALAADEAWTAAHVDEDWNIALWGEDAEAAVRRAGRWQDMKAADDTMALLAGDAR